MLMNLFPCERKIDRVRRALRRRACFARFRPCTVRNRCNGTDRSEIFVPADTVCSCVREIRYRRALIVAARGRLGGLSLERFSVEKNCDEIGDKEVN